MFPANTPRNSACEGGRAETSPLAAAWQLGAISQRGGAAPYQPPFAVPVQAVQLPQHGGQHGEGELVLLFFDALKGVLHPQTTKQVLPDATADGWACGCCADAVATWCSLRPLNMSHQSLTQSRRSGPGPSSSPGTGLLGSCSRVSRISPNREANSEAVCARASGDNEESVATFFSNDGMLCGRGGTD